MTVDFRLWGKERGLGGPRYPLLCHGLDSAAAVRWLWEQYLSPLLRTVISSAFALTDEQTCRVLEFWASAHDIGKAIPGFQAQVAIPDGYSAEPHGPGCKHEEASHIFLSNALLILDHTSSAKNANVIAQLLGGHHGVFQRRDRRDLNPAKHPYLGLGDTPWEQQRAAHLSAWHELIDPPRLDATLPRSIAAITTGLVILADWLVSQTSYVRDRLPQVPTRNDLASMEEFLTGSREETRVLLRQTGLMRLHLRDGPFSEEFSLSNPNSLQDSIAHDLPRHTRTPGLLMIAAPTRFGKTEAALHAARLVGQQAGTSGLFFALPTMATSDEMFRRVAHYITRRTTTETTQSLLHGMAWLKPLQETLDQIRNDEGVSTDTDTQVRAAEWLQGGKRPMLAAVGIGTIDQALLSMLPVRHNVLRMLALAGKTVVIDEVHAFSPYMRTLLATLLGWLGQWNVPVVLLSATLPGHVAAELASAYRGRNKAGIDDEVAVPYPG